MVDQINSQQVNPTPPPNMTPDQQKAWDNAVSLIPKTTPPAQPNVLPTPQGQVFGASAGNTQGFQFGNVLQTAIDRMNTIQPLTQARQLLMKNIYDSPLTPDEIKQLPQEYQTMVQTGDKQEMEMGLRLLNDQISNRTGTLDQSINYLTTQYTNSQASLATAKDTLMGHYFDMIKANETAGNSPTDSATLAQQQLKTAYGQNTLDQLGLNFPDIASQIGITPSSASNPVVQSTLQAMGITQDMPTSQAITQYGMDSIINGAIGQEGGSPAGVQNNPGNMKYDTAVGLGLKCTDSGVKATDGGTFASFATPEEGKQAVGSWFQNHSDMNLSDAIAKYKGVINQQGIDVYSDFKKLLTPEQAKAFDAIPETDKSDIEQLVSGKALLADLVRSRGAAGSAQISRLTKEAMSVDPSFSVNQNKYRYDFLKQWNNPNDKLNITRNSINTALGHLADVKTMTMQLTPDNLQWINKTKNWWSVQTGDPAITNLQFGLNALATETATVYKGAAPATEEIDSMKANLGTQLSSAQFNGLLNTVSQFLSSKITATRYQYKSTMGVEYDQPIIDPDKKQALLSAGIDPDSIAKENVPGSDSTAGGSNATPNPPPAGSVINYQGKNYTVDAQGNLTPQ
jgi:hypothetical protein